MLASHSRHKRLFDDRSIHHLLGFFDEYSRHTAHISHDIRSPAPLFGDATQIRRIRIAQSHRRYRNPRTRHFSHQLIATKRRTVSIAEQYHVLRLRRQKRQFQISQIQSADDIGLARRIHARNARSYRRAIDGSRRRNDDCRHRIEPNHDDPVLRIQHAYTRFNRLFSHRQLRI